jgi:hypothetical protein
MKSPYRWIGTAVLVALTFPFGISAGDGGRSTVVITVAKQDDSPVQIVGFKLLAQVSGLPAIVLLESWKDSIRLESTRGLR